ncbi:MAG: tetratricopeptide repeat protein [Euryarchaeota archaeon]|nr:tetratricopeptide repeat protein [Euryarchaeota archaeon]MBT4407194.1 tetratricopeptide repeat protein [Euryarchaeota archaeon]
MVSMVETPFKNTYSLSAKQLQDLDEAEDMMEKQDLSAAEKMFLAMLEEEADCIPVLNNLGHLYGKHLSEFEKAVEYYQRVLDIEPDNAWARDQRRKYQRFLTYD